MSQQFHFISGLPRSGSTLLSSILRQNPRFHASITSPVGTLFSRVLSEFGPGSEVAPLCSEAQKMEITRNLFSSYYFEQADKEIIFDTNRLWCSRQSALKRLFPESKTICCVRNVAWIMDSFERLTRKNPLDASKMFKKGPERATVYSRTKALAKEDRIVGFAWSALREAFYGEHSDSLLLVEYDALASKPEETMKHVYDFLGEEAFEHDFNNTGSDSPEFDNHMGVPGLHTVREKVEIQPRATILPPDLFRRYANMSFWLSPQGSRAKIIGVKREKPEEAKEAADEKMAEQPELADA